MKRTRRQEKQEKWYSRVREYLSEEMGQAEFCRKTGLKKATFVYWLRKYRSDSDQKTGKGFIALKESYVPSLNFGEPEITLRKGEVELSFSAMPSLEKLIPLIKALT